jgi:hypothetical protein
MSSPRQGDDSSPHSCAIFDTKALSQAASALTYGNRQGEPGPIAVTDERAKSLIGCGDDTIQDRLFPRHGGQDSLRGEGV